jgi:hypothetical protein
LPFATAARTSPVVFPYFLGARRDRARRHERR